MPSAVSLVEMVVYLSLFEVFEDFSIEPRFQIFGTLSISVHKEGGQGGYLIC